MNKSGLGADLLFSTTTHVLGIKVFEENSEFNYVLVFYYKLVVLNSVDFKLRMSRDITALSAFRHSKVHACTPIELD